MSFDSVFNVRLYLLHTAILEARIYYSIASVVESTYIPLMHALSFHFTVFCSSPVTRHC